MLPMPLASAVQLILNQYDVYDVDTLLVMLRSPLDIAQIADLIDNSRELIDATAHIQHTSPCRQRWRQRQWAQQWTALSTCVS